MGALGEISGLCAPSERSCERCELRDLLNCRLEGLFWGFILPALGFLGCSFAGLVLLGKDTGTWWPATMYGLYVGIFFGFLETRVLCSHCPFYFGEGTILRCPVNYGLPRIWAYRPGPLSSAEKATVGAAFIFFGVFPLAILASSVGSGVGGWMLAALLVAAVWLVGTTASMMIWRYCPRCINFYYPFNRVPTALAREYARRTGRSWEA